MKKEKQPVVVAKRSAPIVLPILFENEQVLVVDKPYDAVVHPGAGVEMSETVVGELLKSHPGLPVGNGTDRPGVVHRLDKDTSGVLLIAKSEESLLFYLDQWKTRKVEKIYEALIHGTLEPKTGTIEAPISRNARHRKKMTALVSGGKDAITHYEVLEYFPDSEKPATLVRIRIETGRTHQIRAHFAAIGFPVIGDYLYGSRLVNAYYEKNFELTRQFLHSTSLTFSLMGKDGKAMPRKKQTVESKIPSDLQKVLDDLRDAL